MNNKPESPSFGVKLVLTVSMAILCYLLSMAIFGPMIIDKIGDLSTRIVVISITCLLVWVTVHLLHKKYEDESSVDPEMAPTGSGEPKRRYHLLFFGVMALFMAPFGFAGVLESRGGYLPPLWGGGLCLASGIVLIYLYVKDRKQ